MSNSNLISVVLPVFNGMPWLQGAVESILQQTHSDLELIIVNDCSTDNTKTYIQSLSDSRVQAIHLDKNEGIVSALNEGIKASRGEIVARMDADDISHPMRFEKQLTFLNKNKDYALVCSDIGAFTHASEPSFTEKLAEFEIWYNTGHSDAELKEILPRGNPINHPSLMIRKEWLLLAGGYRKEFQYAEDYDLYIRLSKLTRMFKLPERLVNYRIHPHQISSSLVQEQRAVDATIKANLLLEKYIRANENLIVWGAGSGGQLICEALAKLGVSIDGFIDGNANIWGTTVCGKYVLGGEQALSETHKAFVIIATSVGRQYAENYLSKLGMKKNTDYLAVW